LAQIGREVQAALRANRANGLTDENALDVTALSVAEEAGELIGAYRRWSGHARRSGTLAELAAEVADVLIVTSIFAELAGIDVNEAVRAKVAKIYSRGWREPVETVT
jgi:NTP pyrophosphatase (non-canonical NTP hydrolase)